MGANKFCGCWSLQGSSIAIGFLGVIVALFLVINESFKLATLNIREHTSDIKPELEDKKFKELQMIAETKTVAAGIITSSTIAWILSLMLIYGSMNRNMRLVFPFVYTGFAAVLAIVPIIISIMVYLSNGGAISKDINSTALLVYSVTHFIFTYLWFVVYNFYQELINQ